MNIKVARNFANRSIPLLKNPTKYRFSSIEDLASA
jgi:hypothetical protein